MSLLTRLVDKEVKETQLEKSDTSGKTNEIRCFRCKGNGHTSNKCPRARSPSPVGNSFRSPSPSQSRANLQDVGCFKCGKRGHFAKECPMGEHSHLN